MDYSAVLIAGVTLNRRAFKAGTRTRYNPETGEPKEAPVYGVEMVTDSGFVYHNPESNMTDEEIDDWINPDCGDFCYVGGEAEIHGLGVMICKYYPKHEPEPEIIEYGAIPRHIEKAKLKLADLGITDTVNLLILADAH